VGNVSFNYFSSLSAISADSDKQKKYNENKGINETSSYFFPIEKNDCEWEEKGRKLLMGVVIARCVF
jgi:hypothetical protein